jgi:molecular chaperone DnaK
MPKRTEWRMRAFASWSTPATSSAIAYQVERKLSELGDAVPMHERARAETLVSDARQAVKDEAPLDRVRSLTSGCSRFSMGSGNP